MILLDTDLMVDILRGYEPAKVWLASVEEIGVPDLVAMELIQGSQNAREQRTLENELSEYPLYWPNADDCNRAVKSFSSHHFKRQYRVIGRVDC